MTENQIQSSIIKYLESRGAVVINQMASGGQKRGISDLTACYKGKYIALEIKKPKGTYDLTLAQQVFINKVRKAGGIAGKFTSISEVKELLDNIDSGG